MKNITVAIAAVLLALTMTANAQNLVDFTNLPANATPQPVPYGYAGMDWRSFYYVAAPEYPDANGTINSGPGFYTGDEALLAFIGGPLCFPNYGAPVADGHASQSICRASITSTTSAPFGITQINMSSGWINNQVVITGYLNGHQVGTVRYSLSTTSQTFTLPSWANNVTELVFTPGPQGSVVLYTIVFGTTS